MNIAVLITGTICSGKSKISKKLQEELNVNLIHELNVSPTGIFGMKQAIKTNKSKGIVLIEYAEILSIIDYINEYFEKIIVFLLNVSDEIIFENLNIRKSQNIGGDYLKVGQEYISCMKKDIEKQFNNLKNIYEKHILNISSREDYDIEYEKIISVLNNYKDK